MKIYKFPEILPKGKKTIILGAFGGFHNGHKKLIDEARKYKKPIVLMMIEGISKLISKEKEYIPLEIRLQQFANYGVDYVTLINFKEVKLMSGNEFLKKIIDQTDALNFVGGKDFAMGKGRELKIKDIPNSTIINPIKILDKKISSILLKELVEVGDVKLIRTLAPYYFQMKVHVSSKNIASYDSQNLPHSGVYAVWVDFNEVQYPGVVHINRKKEMFIEVPDFRIKNSNYDPVISFVNLVKKIYKESHDIVSKSDREKVNLSLLNAEE